MGWYGVDLDGTLAHYEGWKDDGEIGKPIPKMVTRVKRWLREGRTVKIMTARVANPQDRAMEVRRIKQWCQEHLGEALPVTHEKDMGLVELWDDRAVEVRINTGEPVNVQRRKD